MKFDDFSKHEALDRASLAREWFSRNVTDHPFVKQTEELSEAADAVEDLLSEFYSLVGEHQTESKPTTTKRAKAGGAA